MGDRRKPQDTVTWRQVLGGRDKMLSRNDKSQSAFVISRWLAFVVFAWMTLGASVARSQEEEPPPPEPAPEPYIPQSDFERPQEESGLDRQLRTCQETLGYVGCDQLMQGGRGRAARPVFGERSPFQLVDCLRLFLRFPVSRGSQRRGVGTLQLGPQGQARLPSPKHILA